jgi:ferritin-like metal-binding protein YciE
MKKLATLYDLYIHELQDLHSAESQIRTSWPEMIKSAHSADLKTALKNHLEVTRDHIDRLNQILKKHGERREQDRCEGMEGLLSECENMIDMDAGEIVYDLGIISACQRVEHYEIAGYGTARAYAERLGEEEDAALLAATLEEEGSADDELTGIAAMLQSQCGEDHGESEDDESSRPKSHRMRFMEVLGRR